MWTNSQLGFDSGSVGPRGRRCNKSKGEASQRLTPRSARIPNLDDHVARSGTSERNARDSVTEAIKQAHDLNGPRAPERGKHGRSGKRSDSGGLDGARIEQWVHAKRMRNDSDNAFGEWLEGLGEWQWFVTRTMGMPVDMGFTKVGLATARRCLRDLLVRVQAKRFACVFEMQEERGVPHLHALLGGCRGVDGNIEVRRDAELWGYARWKAYKRGAGAPAYLGKYLGKDIVEFYVGLDGPYEAVSLKGNTLGGTRV